MIYDYRFNSDKFYTECMVKTKLLQYFNTLFKTYKNDYDRMASIQIYLFGKDPIDPLVEDVYLTSFKLEDLIMDEVRNLDITAQKLQFGFEGHEVAKMMNKICPKCGLIGRAYANVKTYVDYQKDKTEIKVGHLSIPEVIAVLVNEDVFSYYHNNDNHKIVYHPLVHTYLFWKAMEEEFNDDCKLMKVYTTLSKEYCDPSNIIYKLQQG